MWDIAGKRSTGIEDRAKTAFLRLVELLPEGCKGRWKTLLADRKKIHQGFNGLSTTLLHGDMNARNCRRSTIPVEPHLLRLSRARLHLLIWLVRLQSNPRVIRHDLDRLCSSKPERQIYPVRPGVSEHSATHLRRISMPRTSMIRKEFKRQADALTESPHKALYICRHCVDFPIPTTIDAERQTNLTDGPKCSFIQDALYRPPNTKVSEAVPEHQDPSSLFRGITHSPCILTCQRHRFL